MKQVQNMNQFTFLVLITPIKYNWGHRNISSVKTDDYRPINHDEKKSFKYMSLGKVIIHSQFCSLNNCGR